MNNFYRLVWNRALGVVQVASECSSKRIGAPGVRQVERAPRRSRLARACALAIALGLGGAALPVCAGVVNGTAGGNGGNGTVNAAGAAGAGSVSSGTYANAGGQGGDQAHHSGYAGQGANGSGGAPGTPGGSPFGGNSSGGGGAGGNASTQGVGGGGGGGSYYSFSWGGGGGGGGGGVAEFKAANSSGLINNVTAHGGNGGNGGNGYFQNFSGYAGGGGGGGAGSYLSTGSNWTFGSAATSTGGNGGNGGGGFHAADGGGAGSGVSGNGFTATNYGTLQGGVGGNGGGPVSDGGTGGSGGAGGAGVDGTQFSLTNLGAIQGGHGGAGHNDIWAGGNGGDGGVGVSGSGMVLSNAGTITGGDGGVAGTARTSGQTGSGGVGVVSSGNSAITNAGSISGGLGGNGTGMQADAVELAGGGNTLELQAGYSFVGNVISTSGSTNGGDTLILGGDANASFDLAQLTATLPTSYGTAPAYYGFSQYAKHGASTWTLTGTNAGNESWTVNAGTLEVGDVAHPGTVLNGSVTVAGGTLGGHGTIAGNVNNVAGAVMPGGTLGVLTVSGDFTQGANGTLVLEITPNNATPGTTYSQLQVGGKAALGGTLSIQLDPGQYLPHTGYDLVHAAGGVSGTFASVSFNPQLAGYLTSDVVYQANDVYLQLKPNAIAYSSGYPNSVSAVSLSVEDSFNTVLGPMNALTQGREGVWGQFTENQGGLGQGVAFKYDGSAAGYGRAVSGDLVLGAAVSGGAATTRVSPLKVVSKPIGAFLYGIWHPGKLQVAFSLAKGRMSQATTRFLGLMNRVQSTFGHGSYSGEALRLSYTAALGAHAHLTPYAGVDMLDAHYDAVSEKGLQILALHYGKLRQHLSHYQMGVRISAGHGAWRPWASLGMQGWTANRSVMVTENLAGYSKTYRGSRLPNKAMSGGLGLGYHHGHWHAQVSWNGSWGSRFHANQGTLQVRYRW